MEAHQGQELSLVPYCLDLAEKQLIYAAGVDPIRAARATFHYLYLREQAWGFLQVPVERLPATLPAQPHIPALLFSPGRCGSTLLGKLLAAMGVVSISEPDIYSQAASHAFTHQGENIAADHQFAHLLAYAGHSLLAPFLGQGASAFCFKLRSHANYAPGIIVSSFASKPKTIYLLRGFREWCESRQRAFLNPLDSNFNLYVRGLLAFRWLREHTDCLAIHYEELQEHGQEVARRVAAFLGLPPTSANLEHILNTDSQAGTGLARNRLLPELPEDSRAAIRKLWREQAPRALLKELNLNHYL